MQGVPRASVVPTSPEKPGAGAPDSGDAAPAAGFARHPRDAQADVDYLED